jgi:hypothetical protein
VPEPERDCAFPRLLRDCAVPRLLLLDRLLLPDERDDVRRLEGPRFDRDDALRFDREEAPRFERDDALRFERDELLRPAERVDLDRALPDRLDPALRVRPDDPDRERLEVAREPPLLDERALREPLEAVARALRDPERLPLDELPPDEDEDRELRRLPDEPDCERLELLRDRLPCDLLPCDRLPPRLAAPLTRRVPRRAEPRADPPLWRACCCACAVSREISLLKLLFCPCAVWSWYRSASPFSSKALNHSSHDTSSSESAPLYPGKSRRIIPISPLPPVRRTHDGFAPRSSAHRRISSWSVVTFD